MAMRPDTHFLNQMNLLDVVISFLRPSNRCPHSPHLYLCNPWREPHLMLCNEPHFGHLRRLLIFALSLIRRKPFLLICIKLCKSENYKDITNRKCPLYRICRAAARHVRRPSTKKRPRRSEAFLSGGSRIRTGDPMLAKHVLYQLSYTPLKTNLGTLVSP